MPGLFPVKFEVISGITSYAIISRFLKDLEKRKPNLTDIATGSHEKTRLQINRITIIKWAASILGLLGFLELGRAFLALFSPVVIDYCEMTVGGAAEQLRLGASLGDMYSPPVAAYGMPGVQYPPLFILLVAFIRAISGLGIILAERLPAWGLYTASGGLVGWIVWKETGQKWAAIVSAGLPFCFWSVIIFIHAARVDPLALFLSLLAAFVYRCSQSFKNLALVSLLAALAFFSKQTYLAVTAAVFFDLLLSRPKDPVKTQAAAWQVGFLKTLSPDGLRKAVSFGGMFLAWVVAGFGLFGWLSEGEIFGIFDPTRAGSFIFDKAPGFVGFFLLGHLPLILLALYSLRQLWREGQRFWTFYSGFAALACVTIVKDGAVDYYFNELAYLLALSVGLLVARMLKTSSESQLTPNSKTRSWPTGRLIGIGLAVQAVIALGMLIGWSPWKDFNASEAPYRDGLALVNKAYQAEVSGEKPPLVLVDSFLIETGRASQVGDYFIYSVLLRNGKRDATPLIKDLENRRYSLIITETFLRWPPEVEAALSKGYNSGSIKRTDGQIIYLIYRPVENPASGENRTTYKR